MNKTFLLFISEIELILDIGCGSGNLTTFLSEIPRVKHVIAIDFYPNMIEFAEKYNNRNSIQYLAQDFSQEWNELSPELKQFEGKISVIFSNYCLHWIYTKRQNVVKNMYRLLAKNGRIYTNICCFPPSSISNSIIWHICNFFLPIPTEQTQELEWTSSFESVGLEIIDFKSIEIVFTFEFNDFFECEYKNYH